MNKTTTPSVQALLQEAVALHQAGKLDDASRQYQQVLLKQPDNFEAMHFSGVIARQRGNAPEAIAMIQHAIATLGGKFNLNHASAFCNLGTAFQDNLEPEMAMNSYLQAIELRPDYAIAHNNLGNALKKLGRMEDALQSFQNALAYAPNYAEAYFNAGLVLQDAGQFEASVQCFDRAIQIKPADPETWFARGNAWQSMQLHERAVSDFEHSLSLRPDYAKAWFNRGISFNRLTRYEDAIQSFEEAIRTQPRYANAYFYLANTLRLIQKNAEAIAAYQAALEFGADAVQVNFALAGVGVGNPPPAPPPDYVKELFDQYADHFDQHLVEVLEYETPGYLAKLVGQYRHGNQLVTLDLGCGTGLCGSYLRPYSASLTGIDLSQKMLDQAAKRNLYDQLICADITDFLQRATRKIDLIVAADVLVYLGDLQSIFYAAKTALTERGLFCFSVEEAEIGTALYALTSSNRYAHSEKYLRELAGQAGLTIVETSRHIGRMENFQKTNTLILLLENTAHPQHSA